VKYGNKLEDSF